MISKSEIKLLLFEKAYLYKDEIIFLFPELVGQVKTNQFIHVVFRKVNPKGNYFCDKWGLKPMYLEQLVGLPEVDFKTVYKEYIHDRDKYFMIKELNK